MENAKSNKTKCIRVSEETHKKAKDFVDETGYNLGKFTDKAIIEKIEKEKSKKK